MICILETERLLLRPPRGGGYSAISCRCSPISRWRRIFRACLIRIRRTTAAPVIVGTPRSWPNGDGFRLRDSAQRRTALIIGICGVHPERDWEFGYWLGKPYWGQGYATEAAQRLVAFAFEELGRGKC